MACNVMCPGRPYPLGATWDGEGTNFAIFTENGEGVELLLFDKPDDARPSQVYRLVDHTAHTWHAYIEGVGPGKYYMYRVFGPYAPRGGQRYNPAKVLLDPYAKAIAGTVIWDDALFA